MEAWLDAGDVCLGVSMDMFVKKIVIQNFKCFEGRFDLDFSQGLNIIVGDNESGKSSILEALNLALTGWYHGRYIGSGLTESVFNQKIVSAYLDGVNSGQDIDPPLVTIELHCDFGDESTNADFMGAENLDRDNGASGIRFKIYFDRDQCGEYVQAARTNNETLHSLPIEFCNFEWESFSGNSKIPRTIPLQASFIDSSSFRYANGSDISSSVIVRGYLTEEEQLAVAQSHRKLKDIFSKEPSVQKINSKITGLNVSDRSLTLQVETSTRTSWESSLVPYLDEIPFQNVGKGEQSLIKTKLALQAKRARESNILLIEEPENHLTHSRMNELIDYIKNSSEKQVITATHSSFVANKMGLDNLILLNVDKATDKREGLRIQQLDSTTQEFFEKLSGYDTLRLILCRKAILVEGDSDELIVQRAYKDVFKKLPIQEGVDVISVGTAFKRFLDIAKELKCQVSVVLDNDGDYQNNIAQRYKDYVNIKTVKICASDDPLLYSLEPQIVEANTDNLDLLRSILDIKSEKYPDKSSIIKYMENNKTSSALKIFASGDVLKMPQYIQDAIAKGK